MADHPIFTGWESSRPETCSCDNNVIWPRGTIWRWIPWLSQWVCPACAERHAPDYDLKMIGIASRAVAFIPALPAVEASLDVQFAKMEIAPARPPADLARYKIKIASVDGQLATQGGLW